MTATEPPCLTHANAPLRLSAPAHIEWPITSERYLSKRLLAYHAPALKTTTAAARPPARAA